MNTDLSTLRDVPEHGISVWWEEPGTMWADTWSPGWGYVVLGGDITYWDCAHYSAVSAVIDLTICCYIFYFPLIFVKPLVSCRVVLFLLLYCFTWFSCHPARFVTVYRVVWVTVVTCCWSMVYLSYLYKTRATHVNVYSIDSDLANNITLSQAIVPVKLVRVLVIDLQWCLKCKL